jgi:MFS family permease
MEEISALRRYSMWFCAACFYGFQFILRVSPGIIANDLKTTLMIDACVLGTIISFYYTCYSLMQVPTGLILDRFGVRIPLSIACLLCSLGSLIFTYGDSVAVFSLGRALMGMGSAFGFLSCVKVASQNFVAQRLAMFISLTMVVGTTGGMSAGTPFAGLVSCVGWREAYKFMAISGGFISILILFVFHNGSTTHHVQTAAAARSEDVLTAVTTILRNPQTWIYGLYGFMMYVPLSGFVDLWAVPYIQEAFKVERAAAGGVVTMSYIGLASGAPLWSVYAAKVKSYKKAMFGSALCTGTLFGLVIYLPKFGVDTPSGLNLIYVLMALGGAASAGQFIAFAGVSEINPSHRTATASGVHNMLCMASGVVMMPLIGALLDMVGVMKTAEGVAKYTAPDFQVALSIIPISVLLAVISMYFIKESYPLEDKKACKKEPAPLHEKK